MIALRAALVAYVVPFVAALLSTSAAAQTVLSTVPTGGSPQAMVVNPVNNKTYIAQHGAGTVRVINGATGAVTDVDVSFRGAPRVLAINPVNQRVMVGTDQGIVVIDGTTDGIAAQTDLSFASPAINAIAFNAADSNQFYLPDTPNNTVFEFQDNAGGTQMAINFSINIPCPTAVASNPVTGSAYITNPCNDSVAAHTNTFPFGSYIDIGPGSAPIAVAVNPVTNRIYVALSGTHGVAVIDGSSNTVTTTIATGFSSPTAIAVNPATNKIYVANASTNDITIINGADNSTTTGVAPAGNPVGITIDNVRNQVYVANQGAGTVSVIDGATNAVTPLTVGASPNLISVNPLTSRVFVASTANKTLTTIDGRRYTHGTITAAHSRATAVNPIARRAYIALGGSPNGSVKIINEATDSEVPGSPVTVGADPSSIAVDLGLNRIYTSNATDGTVTAINGSDNTVAGTVTVGAGPGAIAVNPLTHKVYVTQPASGSVVVFDGTNLTGGVHIANVGGTPLALAVNVVTNKVYVADGSASASNPVIDGATNAVTTMVGGFPVPAATDVAVDAATNHIFVARPGVNTVEEFDGGLQVAINDYTVTSPASLAVNSITNHVYVATGTTALQVLDPVTVGVTSITLPENTRFVAVDEYADRVYVSGTTRAFTVDGESATVSTTVSPVTGTSPGLPAIDSSTGKAYVPVPAGASTVVVKEATPVPLQNHGIGGVTAAQISSNPNATLSVTSISLNYAPSNPAVITVNSGQDDLYGGNTASASPGPPFAIALAGLTRGLHFVTLFATDTMAGTSIDTQSGSSGGTSFMIGRPAIFPLLTIDPPSITTPTLAGGTEGITYSQAVAATGGTGGTTFSLASGALPDGVSIATDGTISGTPTLAGTYNFTVAATDNSGGSGTAPLAIIIAVGTPSLSRLPTSLSFGSVLVGQSSNGQSVTISNIGWGTGLVSSVAFTSGAADYAISSNGCTVSTQLAHTQNCAIVVSFSPSTTGTRNGNLRVITNDPVLATIDVPLTGTGLPNTFTLTAATDGNGMGAIASAPAGIACPGDCTELYNAGTSVTLTATANAGSAFAQWTGCDAVVANQCTVSVGNDRTVTATFTALTVYNIVLEGFQEAPYVVSAGSGSGTATFNPVTGELSFNISYSGTSGPEMSSSLNGPAARGASAPSIDPMSSTTTKIDAIHLSPAQQTQLLSGQLYVNIATAAHPDGELRAQIDNLGATLTHTFTLLKAGAGLGTVGGLSEAGAVLDCGTTCTAVIPDGKVISLLSLAAIGSRFGGWSGACTGTGNCDVTMNADQTVTITYDLIPPGLAVAPLFVDFGGESMGTTSPGQAVTLTNNGASPVTFNAIAVDGPFAQVNDCPASLPVNATCTVTVTFNPVPSGDPINTSLPASGALTITSDAAGSPHRLILNGSAEKSLVAHYYRAILRRAPDQGGHDFWQSEAARVAGLGANVNETWFALSLSFFGSGEYAAFNRDNAGYLTDLYNTFFNRAPDSDGFSFWMNNMAQGMPREAVLVQFLFSPEFAAFTQQIFGNTQVRAEMDMTMDMYRGILGRLPDSGGYNFFLGQFRQAQCTSADAVRAQAEQVSHDFFNSPEYGARNRTNAQYMADIYNAIMRRGADLGGIDFWIGQLNAGAQTREQVRQQFVASPEFSNRVTNVITAGCLP